MVEVTLSDFSGWGREAMELLSGSLGTLALEKPQPWKGLITPRLIATLETLHADAPD